MKIIIVLYSIVNIHIDACQLAQCGFQQIIYQTCQMRISIPTTKSSRSNACKFIPNRERETVCCGWREASGDILLAASASSFHAIYQP